MPYISEPVDVLIVQVFCASQLMLFMLVAYWHKTTSFTNKLAFLSFFVDVCGVGLFI